MRKTSFNLLSIWKCLEHGRISIAQIPCQYNHKYKIYELNCSVNELKPPSFYLIYDKHDKYGGHTIHNILLL